MLHKAEGGEEFVPCPDKGEYPGGKNPRQDDGDQDLHKHPNGTAAVNLGGLFHLPGNPVNKAHQGVSELVEAFPVKTVDTTGAGDAFTAALGVATAEGAELKEAAVYAAAAAALSTTRYGVIESLPTRDETTAFLHTSGGISINI